MIRVNSYANRMLLRAGLVAAAALSVGIVTAGSGAAATTSAGHETVAAIDPALTAGRGASLGFAEQEAENAATNGTVLPFDTTAYTLSSEASGRQAVKLLPG